MSRAPTSHVVVAALIRRGDEVLLVRQQGPNDAAASWALPGGVVEHGESLDEALKREVREETGLEVLAIGPLQYVAQMVNGTKQSGPAGEVPQAGAQSIAFIVAVRMVMTLSPSRWMSLRSDDRTIHPAPCIARMENMLQEARVVPYRSIR